MTGGRSTAGYTLRSNSHLQPGVTLQPWRQVGELRPGGRKNTENRRFTGWVTITSQQEHLSFPGPMRRLGMLFGVCVSPRLLVLLIPLNFRPPIIPINVRHPSHQATMITWLGWSAPTQNRFRKFQGILFELMPHIYIYTYIYIIIYTYICIFYNHIYIYVYI